MDLMSLLAKLTLDKSDYDKGLEEAQKDAEGLKVPQPVIPRTDNSQFREGLEEAEDTGNWFKEVMSGVWQGVKDAIVTTGIMGIVTSIIGAMRQGISLAIQNGKEINDNAKNLQISTKAYQEYEWVLGRSNLKTKDLSKAMDNLGKIFSGDLNDKQKKYVEELKEMGFSADKAASKEENLTSMMKALADYQGDDKGQIIDWLFGSNQNWTGFFDQTSTEIDQLKQEAEDLGLIMSDESIENAVKFTETTEKISEKLESIKRSFGEGIVPLLNDALDKVVIIMSLFEGKKSLSQMFSDSDKEFSNQLLTIEGTGAAAETLADKLLAMGNTSKMTAEQYKLWKSTAEKLIELVPSLGKVIDTESGKINANSKEIRENIRQWEELAKQKALQTLKEEKYQQLVMKNQELIDKNVGLNTKEADLASKKAQAVAKANELMQKNSAIYQKFQKAFGVDEITDYSQVQWLQAATQHYTGFGELDTYINEVSAAWGEVLNATNEVQTLKDQLEEGKQQYEAWLESLDELYGTTNDDADTAKSKAIDLKKAIDDLPSRKDIYLNIISAPRAFAQAKGNWDVPYDNYPSLLHRNEMVLTASEARRYREGETNNVNITDLEDRIIAAIQKGMSDATVNAYMDGDKVTREVIDRLARKNDARRYG